MDINSFENRHIGASQDDIKKMLNTIGLDSVSELIHQTIPNSILKNSPLKIRDAITENDYLKKLKEIADLNKDFDWELPPTSEEALRLIRECTMKVKNGDHSKASLHNAIDELYSHEEIQKYYNKDDLFYIVDGNAGLVTKNN